MRRARNRELCAFAYALVIAAAVLFFCTKSSPAYPLNDWCDANIYFTIGKGMTRGQVVYRDLYDHKGPLLYALHALCAWVSFDSFLGVYLMQTLAAAVFLYVCYRLLTRYGAARGAWVALPFLALAVYSAYSLCEGDSAEELCMPLVAVSLCHVLGYLRGGDRRMSVRGLLAEGALVGCVFWMKFTLIGMHAGLLLCVLLRYAARREWREAGRALGWLAAGFALSTLPWVVYFGLNSALGDWLGVYLYDNLFRYGGEALSLGAKLRACVATGAEWLVSNLRYTLPLVGGLAWLTVSRRFGAWERAAAWLAAGLGAVAVFIGGKEYPYYGQALAPLAALGFVPLALLCERALARLKRGARVCLCAAACALCVGLCPLVARNMTLSYGAQFGQARESLMQYQFAAHMPPDATLLNYGFMDAGFYTAAGVVPNVKYFHENNVPLPEMRTEQERYVNEAVCDYVVTRGKEPKSLLENYELIATADTPEFWYEHAYLYRRKTLR